MLHRPVELAKYVTVVIDLTAIRDGTGPAWQLDCSRAAPSRAWLAGREEALREAVEVVAMDGFTRFKTATAGELPAAVVVMDPFHLGHFHFAWI